MIPPSAPFDSPLLTAPVRPPVNKVEVASSVVVCPSEITTITVAKPSLPLASVVVIIMDDSDDIEADSSGSVDVDRIVVAMGVPSDVKLETMVWTLVPISVLVSVPVTMIVEVVSLGGVVALVVVVVGPLVG
jgi:hypothetical protein